LTADKPGIRTGPPRRSTPRMRHAEARWKISRIGWDGSSWLGFRRDTGVDYPPGKTWSDISLEFDRNNPVKIAQKKTGINSI
jgi:hypothetical protein